MFVYCVYIEIGHGGRDPGAVGNGLRESDVNLEQALMMKAELERHGVNVEISRTGDEDDPLTEAIQGAVAFKPDVAVGIHNNAGGGKGFEVYRQTASNVAAASTRLAECIEKRVLTIGQNSRGVKTLVQSNGTDYFGWLRQIPFPSVLCEGAFVDNAADAAMIDTVEEQQAFGTAYAKGVLDYFNIEWKPAGNEQEKEKEEEEEKVIYGVMKQVIALSDKGQAQEYAAAMNKKEPGAYWFIMEK